MNKEADLENVPRESAALSRFPCLLGVVQLVGILFALACGTPPRPAVPAGELLLLDANGKPVKVGQSLDEDALYYHTDDNATPYTGFIEADYPNGGKRMLANVRVGRLHGSSLIWYKNSDRVHLDVEYQSGRIYSYREYYEENGTVKMEWPEPPPARQPGEVLLSDLETRPPSRLLYPRDGGFKTFTGTAIELWPDGSLKSRGGVKVGEWFGPVNWWHNNGKPWYSATFDTFMTGYLSENFPVGEAKVWRRNFSREVITTWDNKFTREEGKGPNYGPTQKVKIITYAPDGTESGRMEEGNGTLIYYHATGNKKLVQVWNGSRFAPAQEIHYDENGVQIDPSPTQK